MPAGDRDTAVRGLRFKLMGIRSWLGRILNPATDPDTHEPRHVRRKAARERAKGTGAEHWSESDRHVRPNRRQVDDTGGLGMGLGGERTIDDR